MASPQCIVQTPLRASDGAFLRGNRCAVRDLAFSVRVAFSVVSKQSLCATPSRAWASQLLTGKCVQSEKKKGYTMNGSHTTDQECFITPTADALHALGVGWQHHSCAAHLDPESVLNQWCNQHGCDSRDFVDSRAISDLRGKLQAFHAEHLHTDDEVRFFVEGSGYFDVRHELEARRPWVRLHCHAGDLVILPAGCFHRFVPDQGMFFHVMRVFSGVPVWTPFSRDATSESMPVRHRYLDQVRARLRQQAESVSI